MTLTFEATPEEVQRVEAARLAGVDVDAAIREVINRLPVPANVAPATAGAKAIERLRKRGVLGMWQDRPESSEELARQFRKKAQTRGPLS